MPTYRRSYAPRSYTRYQAHCEQVAHAKAVKIARTTSKTIAEAIEARGDNISDDGRVFLEGLAKAFGEIDRGMRGR